MKKTLLTASIIAITLSGSALAAKNTAAKDQLTGFYAGADVGYSSSALDDSINKISAKDSLSGKAYDLTKNNPLAFGARLGYLMKVNNDFKAGVEYSYYSMGNLKPSDETSKAVKEVNAAKPGSVSDDSGKLTSSNMELEAVGQYTVAPNFYLEGKAGIANGTTKLSGGDSGSKINPAFDIGAGYKVMPNLALSGDFKYIMGDKKLGSEDVNATKSKPAPVMGFLAGVTYNF